MARPEGAFRLEAAGSLTPELEGGSSSQRHHRAGINRGKKGTKQDYAEKTPAYRAKKGTGHGKD